MIATLLSVGLALLFSFYYQAIPSPFFPIVALTVGALMLLITPLIKGLTYLPLQAASVEISSHSLQYARKDLRLKVLAAVWILFGLFSIVVSVFNAHYLFFIWIVWLGVSLDAIYWYVRRVTGYCDPHAVVRYLESDGTDVIGVIGQEKELLDAIDGLSEVGLKALLQRGTALADHVVTAMEKIAEEVVQEITRERDKGRFTHEEGRDHIHFSLGYLLQRMQMFFNQAGDEGIEPLQSRILMSISKMVLFTADYGEEEAALPFHFIDQLWQSAEENDYRGVQQNAPAIFFQLATKLMDKKTSVAGLLLGIIDKMDEQAKERFKHDKNTPIETLTEPFHELNRIIEERQPTFDDVEIVKGAIANIIGDFAALQEILLKVPNIPGYSSKKETEVESDQ